MEREAHVSERVFDLGPIVEAEAADKFVADASAAEDFLERARLEVGAVLDGAGEGRVVVENAAELACDKFGFGERVAAFEIFQIDAGAIFGAERFAESIGIVGDDGARGVKNILR